MAPEMAGLYSRNSKITTPAPQTELATGRPARWAAVTSPARIIPANPAPIKIKDSRITGSHDIVLMRLSWWAKPIIQYPPNSAKVNKTSPRRLLGLQIPDKASASPRAGKAAVRSGHLRKHHSRGGLIRTSHR